MSDSNIQITSQSDRGNVLIIGAILALVIAFVAYKMYQALTKREVDKF